MLTMPIEDRSLWTVSESKAKKIRFQLVQVRLIKIQLFRFVYV